jgi:hypothetical protein
MDDLDLTNLLDGDTGPRATPEILGRIVARQRQRQARRYRVVATTAVVAMLACAGVGIGLEQHRSTTVTATGASSQAPAGLKWDAPQALKGAAAPAGSNSGDFAAGRSKGASSASSSGNSYGAPVSVNGLTTGFGPDIPAPCAAKGCDVVFNSDVRQLFTQHDQGLSIVVSLATYHYPSTIAIGNVSVPPDLSVSSPGASSPTTGGSPPSPGAAIPATNPLPSISPKSLVPVTTTCPVESELIIDVSYGSVTRTVVIPAGGVVDKPISVVASASTTFGSAGSVVLVVTRTSDAVSLVSATFPGLSPEAMAPKDGWAVLTARFPAGTNLAKVGAIDVEASGAPGKVLEGVHLPTTGSLATAPVLSVCHFLVVPINVVSPPSSRSPGTAGSSSAGTGSTAVAGAQPSS